MTKGKNVSIPTSLEAQIRTRARNLPIYKCYINKDWEKSQTATVIISRKHTNGNITVGNFLVDLKLRGVKDCYCMFNESPLRMDGILEKNAGQFEECDYSLAHNVIHAGLEFAGDYGFTPCKEFKTAQYILEEDTDDIPLIEIPLGDNGIPVLEIPYGETGQHEFAILSKTAGADFRVVYFDKNGKPEREKRTYMEIFGEVMETGIEGYREKHDSDPDDVDSDRERQVMIDLIYLMKAYTDDEKDQIDLEFDSIVKDPRLTMPADTPENDHEKDLALSVRYFEEGKSDKACAEIRKVINQYPDDTLLWDVLLHNLSVDSDKVDEEAVKEAYSRFPDHPVIKAWYAEWLAQEERPDEVFALFGNVPGLDALTTGNIYIDLDALTSFCYAYAMAWLSRKEILRAEPYYQVIVRLGLDNRIGYDIQQMMTELKHDKLAEIFV